MLPFFFQQKQIELSLKNTKKKILIYLSYVYIVRQPKCLYKPDMFYGVWFLPTPTYFFIFWLVSKKKKRPRYYQPNKQQTDPKLSGFYKYRNVPMRYGFAFRFPTLPTKQSVVCVFLPIRIPGEKFSTVAKANETNVRRVSIFCFKNRKKSVTGTRLPIVGSQIWRPRLFSSYIQGDSHFLDVFDHTRSSAAK